MDLELIKCKDRPQFDQFIAEVSREKMDILHAKITVTQNYTSKSKRIRNID